MTSYFIRKSSSIRKSTFVISWASIIFIVQQIFIYETSALFCCFKINQYQLKKKKIHGSERPPNIQKSASIVTGLFVHSLKVRLGYVFFSWVNSPVLLGNLFVNIYNLKSIKTFYLHGKKEIHDKLFHL